MLVKILKEHIFTEDIAWLFVECGGQNFEIIVKYENEEYQFFYLNGSKPDYLNFEQEVLHVI